MNYFTLIALWLFVPSIAFFAAVLRIRRLRRQREHDLILYTFCDARDTVAVKAARGEVDERTETFKYFYERLSKIVHDHKRHPIGFGHIAKNLEENRNRPPPTWVRRLLRELKRSDNETKQMVLRYIAAIELVMKQDPIIAALDKLPHWFRKHGGFFRSLADQPMLSRRKRSFARFNLALAKVAAGSSSPVVLVPAAA
jgi:hypothetical protein